MSRRFPDHDGPGYLGLHRKRRHEERIRERARSLQAKYPDMGWPEAMKISRELDAFIREEQRNAKTP